MIPLRSATHIVIGWCQHGYAAKWNLPFVLMGVDDSLSMLITVD